MAHQHNVGHTVPSVTDCCCLRKFGSMNSKLTTTRLIGLQSKICQFDDIISGAVLRYMYTATVVDIRGNACVMSDEISMRKR